VAKAAKANVCREGLGKIRAYCSFSEGPKMMEEDEASD
jgi:hypothetical protein